ncbi:MAG: hypothetical protein QG597_4425 [Actinomycetota bacterium]|nr:hypothetical protein [Actinomycetota bacterium]
MSAAEPVSRPKETQVDRTRLSWRRTTLSATVVTAVGLRDAVGGSADGVRVLALLTVLAAWLAIVLVAERRIVDLVNRGHLQAGRFPAVMAGAVLLLAVGGLAASQLWF